LAGGSLGADTRWRVVQSAERQTLDLDVAGSIPAPPALAMSRDIVHRRPEASEPDLARHLDIFGVVRGLATIHYGSAFKSVGGS
jgi:hypothetical protein